ncbi:MAG: hypothetical protein NTY53_20535 [Kiritimatiellaeota bacterium]|nr:hypothetical protein [Kiritimatiellota bacterium]
MNFKWEFLVRRRDTLPSKEGGPTLCEGGTAPFPKLGKDLLDFSKAWNPDVVTFPTSGKSTGFGFQSLEAYLAARCQGWSSIR